MQKILVEPKNIPTDASQVCSSIISELNMDQTSYPLSEAKCSEEVLTNITTDVNQFGSNRKQNTSVSVYVLNMRGNPLMPCSPCKAKKLLKQRKAKIVKRTPFTIKLTRATGETKQDVTLGIDTGYKNIGVSAVSKKRELLSSTVQLRTNISDMLKERTMYRKGRRNKLWYREPRWNNRANSRKNGRLMPSVLQKVNTHITVIERIKKLLPISKIIIETGLFDMAKMKDSEIRNWEYQKGEQHGFENTKAYVLSKDNHTCYFNSNCSDKLHVHHIKFRRQGGSNNPNNLIALCEKHHKQVHDGKIVLPVKKHKELKSATIMNVIRKRLLEYFISAEETFGYVTKVKIRELGLAKTHSNDAFVIANGTSQERCKTFDIVQKRRNNRCLQLNRKGFKPSIKKRRSKIQPLDLFWVKGKQYVCKGMFNYSKYICYGSTKLKEYFKISQVERYYHQGSLVWN